MLPKHKLGLYIAYYLSKFNKVGYRRLGFRNLKEALTELSKMLNVKYNTLKNWRDEFDPLHGHRAGWHQRPMIASRVKVANALQNLCEEEVREIVLDILDSNKLNDSENMDELLSIVKDDIPNKKPKISKYILRGPTGKKAEEFFIDQFKKNKFSILGELKDTREHGKGYDFEIRNKETILYVEVKGLQEIFGGILLTNKEWITAIDKKEKYYLIIVRTLKSKPVMQVIQNPASVLQPKKSIYTTVQVQWSVSNKQLVNI